MVGCLVGFNKPLEGTLLRNMTRVEKIQRCFNSILTRCWSRMASQKRRKLPVQD